MLLRSEVTDFYKPFRVEHNQLYKTIPTLHQNESDGSGALGKTVRHVVLVFESRPWQK